MFVVHDEEDLSGNRRPDIARGDRTHLVREHCFTIPIIQ